MCMVLTVHYELLLPKGSTKLWHSNKDTIGTHVDTPSVYHTAWVRHWHPLTRASVHDLYLGKQYLRGLRDSDRNLLQHELLAKSYGKKRANVISGCIRKENNKQ